FFNSLLSCKVFAKLSGTFTPFFVSIRSDICFFTMTANGPAALRSFDRALLGSELCKTACCAPVRVAAVVHQAVEAAGPLQRKERSGLRIIFQIYAIIFFT